MCDITKFLEKADAIDAYLSYVNTEVDRLMKFEPELYAAYAAHNDLGIENIKGWYRGAEDAFISVYGIDMYLTIKYEIVNEDQLDYFYEKEVHKDGTLYECAGYWFTKD